MWPLDRTYIHIIHVNWFLLRTNHAFTWINIIQHIHRLFMVRTSYICSTGKLNMKVLDELMDYPKVWWYDMYCLFILIHLYGLCSNYILFWSYAYLELYHVNGIYFIFHDTKSVDRSEWTLYWREIRENQTDAMVVPSVIASASTIWFHISIQIITR